MPETEQHYYYLLCIQGLKILKSCVFSPSPGQDRCTIIIISSYEKDFTRVIKAAIFSQKSLERPTANPSASQEMCMQKHCIMFQLSRGLEKLLLTMMWLTLHTEGMGFSSLGAHNS